MEQFYFFHKFFGLYHYLYGNLFEAKDYYEHALLHYSDYIGNKVGRSEKADLHFIIGLNDNKIYYTNSSIHHLKLALSIYNELYNIKRSADCHITLGVCYKQTNQFDNAKKHYDMAIKASDNIQNEQIKGIIYQNMGELSKKEEDLEKSIEHFKASFMFKQAASIKSKLITIISIIEVFDLLKKKDDMEEWIQKGLKLISEEDLSNYRNLYYMLKVFELKELSSEDLESFLKLDVIPFFIQRGDDQFVSKFSQMLSQQYQDKNKYKDACYYLELSNTSLKKIAKYTN